MAKCRYHWRKLEAGPQWVQLIVNPDSTCYFPVAGVASSVYLGNKWPQPVMRCLPNWTPSSKRSRGLWSRSWHDVLPQTDFADISASTYRKIRRQYPDFVGALGNPHYYSPLDVYTQEISRLLSHVLNQDTHKPEITQSALLVSRLQYNRTLCSPRNKGSGQQNQRSASPVHQRVLRWTWTKGRCPRNSMAQSSVYSNPKKRIPSGRSLEKNPVQLYIDPIWGLEWKSREGFSEFFHVHLRKPRASSLRRYLQVADQGCHQCLFGGVGGIYLI